MRLSAVIRTAFKAGGLVSLLIIPAWTLPAKPADAPGNGGWRAFDELVAGPQKTMMADPAAALKDAKSAVDFARKQPPSARVREASATALWLESEALVRTNRIPEGRL